MARCRQIEKWGIKRRKGQMIHHPAFPARSCPKHYNGLAFSFYFIASVLFQLNEEKECAIGDVSIAHM